MSSHDHTTKTCTVCASELPVSEFYARTARCKLCTREYQMKRYEANKPKRIAQVLDRKKKKRAADVATARAADRDWYARHKERLCAEQRTRYNTHESAVRRRGYYAQNKDRIAARNAAWFVANPGKRAEYSVRRLAAEIQASPTWRDTARIAEIYDDAARLREAGKDVHVDHIIPLRGKNVCGLHVHTNLRIIPARDNLIKSNKFHSITA